MFLWLDKHQKVIMSDDFLVMQVAGSISASTQTQKACDDELYMAWFLYWHPPWFHSFQTCYINEQRARSKVWHLQHIKSYRIFGTYVTGFGFLVFPIHTLYCNIQCHVIGYLLMYANVRGRSSSSEWPPRRDWKRWRARRGARCSWFPWEWGHRRLQRVASR